MTLPTGIETMNYAGDIILIGVNMTQERYNEIMQGLSESDRLKVIGWRTISKGGAGNG